MVGLYVLASVALGLVSRADAASVAYSVPSTPGSNAAELDAAPVGVS